MSRLVYAQSFPAVVGSTVRDRRAIQMKVPNDCIADRIRLAIPQATERQHIGN